MGFELGTLSTTVRERRGATHDRYRHAVRVMDLADGDCVPPPLPLGYEVATATTDELRQAAAAAADNRFREAGLDTDASPVSVVEPTIPIAVSREGRVVGTLGIRVGPWAITGAAALYDLGADTPDGLVAEFDGFAVAADETHPFIVVHLFREVITAVAALGVPTVVAVANPTVIDLTDATTGTHCLRHPRRVIRHGREAQLLWVDAADFIDRLVVERPAYAEWLQEGWNPAWVEAVRSAGPRPIPGFVRPIR